MLKLLLVPWAVRCLGSPALADEPTGILLVPESPSAPRVGETASGLTEGKRQKLGQDLESYFPTTGVDWRGGRYSSALATRDLENACRSSVDGLVELNYAVYLTHALLLSSAEAKAYDLRRMPLHRFASPLAPEQIAEVPIGTVGGPRPFHMFVLFTFVDGRTDAVAEGLSRQCKECAAALVAFRKTSRAYKIFGSSALAKDLLPVFFGVVNVGARNGAAISAIHPAMQLPIVVHLPPTTATATYNVVRYKGAKAPTEALKEGSEGAAAKGSFQVAWHHMRTAEFFVEALGCDDEDTQLRELLSKQQREGLHGKVLFFSFPESHLLLLQRRKNEASLEQRLLQWVNTRTNRQVGPALGEDAARPQLRGRALLFLLPLAIPLIWFLVSKVVAFLRRNQWLIPAGGVIAYTLCCSGLVFSVIHSVPVAGYDPANSRYVLVAPTSRAQYLLEGLLLSCCSTLASLAGLGLSQLWSSPRRLTHDAPTDSGETGTPIIGAAGAGAEASRVSEWEARWRPRFELASFVLLAAAMVYCSGFVLQCYRSKNSWYAPTFWPSSRLQRGPLKLDWGNMF